MLLERRTVSRKTPLDGMLEISADAAARLAPLLGDDFALASAGRTGRARLRSMPCGCAKGAGGGHVHHFVESPLLTSLVPESVVRVELDDAPAAAARLRIEPAE